MSGPNASNSGTRVRPYLWQRGLLYAIFTLYGLFLLVWFVGAFLFPTDDAWPRRLDRVVVTLIAFLPSIFVLVVVGRVELDRHLRHRVRCERQRGVFHDPDDLNRLFKRSPAGELRIAGPDLPPNCVAVEREKRSIRIQTVFFTQAAVVVGVLGVLILTSPKSQKDPTPLHWTLLAWLFLSAVVCVIADRWWKRRDRPLPTDCPRCGERAATENAPSACPTCGAERKDQRTESN